METKTRILDASCKLFSRKGYYETSIKDIATESRVSQGLLYNYFSGKDALVEQLIKSSINDILTTLREIEPTKSIDEYLKIYLSLVQVNQDSWKIMSSLWFYEDFHHQISQYRQVLRDKIASFIEESLKCSDRAYLATKIPLALNCLDGYTDQPIDQPASPNDFVDNLLATFFAQSFEKAKSKEEISFIDFVLSFFRR